MEETTFDFEDGNGPVPAKFSRSIRSHDQIDTTPPDRFAHIDLVDLDSDDEEEATQLAPFLFTNSITAVLGVSGVGKTNLALDLVLRTIKAGYRVLYLDYEMTLGDLKNNINNFDTTEVKNILNDHLYLASTDTEEELPPFDNSDSSISYYLEVIDTLKIDLVVIDTFSMLVAEEQSASSAERARRQLSRLRHHTAFLVVDSTFDDRGTLDISLIMKATRKKDHLAIKVEKDREDLIGATSWSIVRKWYPALTHSIENDKDY